MLPYYFDLPELQLPDEVFKIPYIQHPSDFMSPTGKGQGGKTFQYRAVPTGWYKIVSEFAKYKSVKIINNANESLIDAFEFKNIRVNKL